MKILRNGRGNLEKIIRKKNVDGMCRLSGFVFLHDNGKKLLAKHTFPLNPSSNPAESRPLTAVDGGSDNPTSL